MASPALGSPPRQRHGVADRQLVRVAAIVFVIASLVAIAGPLISYRSDVAQTRDLFRERVAHEARFHADALARTLRLLAAELSRLAHRPEIDPSDPSLESEHLLLDLAHRESVLFSAVAIVDTTGRVLWSEPKSLDPADLGPANWLRALHGAGSAVVEVARPGRRTLLVAVPVERGGVTTGAVVGVFDPAFEADAAGRVSRDLQLLVADRSGNVITPAHATIGGTPYAELVDRLPSLLAHPGGTMLELGHEDLFAAESPVGETGLRVVLVGSESTVTAPVRRRFLGQLLLLMTLQTSAVVLLGIVVQRTYRRFVQMERGAVEQDRLVALGGASSLIAHEVKNSLNGLKAAASVLGDEGDRALPVRTIRAEVDRLQHLAASLLSFGKPTIAQPRPTDLAPLVEDVVEGLRELPGAEEIRITTDLPRGAAAWCDPLLVTTAVHNVVRNAIEAAVAAKDSGRNAAPQVHVALRCNETSAEVVVEDDAGGLAPEVAERLFTPFVSGKPSGIGLGLAMARRALEAEGCDLTFARTAAGCRFGVRLPLARESDAREER
ncbi:sensor histidine kinase [Candidatus Binatia bacterium]|nr:sensor histidine kinase [Candidatus Binatia bacterium]